MPRQPEQRPPAALRVIISVSGGVADVVLKPKGLEVCIFDYDVDSEDADRLDRDPDGQLCCIARWDAGTPVIGSKHWPIVHGAAKRIAEHRKQRWQCPECRRIVHCSDESLAEAGTPHCPDCDRAMQIV